MAAVIAFSLFAFLVSAISYYGYRWYVRPSRVYQQVGGAATVSMPSVHKLSDAEEPGLTVRILEVIGEQVPVSPDDTNAVRRDLIAAGFRSLRAAAVFYGIRIVFFLVVILLSFALKDYVTQNSILKVVVVFVGGFVGFFLPQFVLEKMIDSRQEALKLSLPDALDLLVVSVEAGLALDQAIQYVARELLLTHKELSEELALVNLEMRAGKRRADALRNLASRTGEPEIRKLVAILIQTDRFGTNIADSLRTHSDFMRVRRRQEAEERAGKVGVKLVFPIFFLILPAMMVVSAGPGLLQVFKYLFPMMKQYRM